MLGYQLRKEHFVEHLDPIFGVESYDLWCHEFLKGPGSEEPFALKEFSFPVFKRKCISFQRPRTCRHILEIRVAVLRTLVPLIHRVNGFRKLRAAALVDTARIYPAPIQRIILGLKAA